MEKYTEKTGKDLEKGQLEMSHKRKGKDEYDEVNEKYESVGGGRRSTDKKGSESKSQGSSSSHKQSKKVTPRKSPRKSPQKVIAL